MKKNQIWIVEVKFLDASQPKWRPVAAVGLSKDDGKRKLLEWKRKLPDDPLRLVKYQA